MQAIQFQDTPALEAEEAIELEAHQLLGSIQTQETSELLVSPSQLRAWKDCPKKHDFIYHKNLRSKQRTTFFDKGNYTHELMHHYYFMLQGGHYLIGSDQLVTAMLARIRNDVRLHAEPQNVNIYNSVMKLMSRYIVIQSPRIDKGIKILGIEAELKLPTGIYTEDGREIILFGFADLIYRTLRGDLVIRDHKTGSNPRRWNQRTLEADFQMLCYGSWIHKMRGEVPAVEINFCNTYEYKNTPGDNQFNQYTYKHSEKVYETFYEETLQLIEDMLRSGPTPHYGDQCTSCPFQEPCFLQRKGLSVRNLIEANYEKVDRSAPIRPVPYTSSENNSDGR